jgi:ATP phosphoribosyltransferase regulatory subunit
MIHQAPAGARDLLPLEVVQKSWINDRLQEIFQSWGYQRIVTSTLEWLDTLTAGGAIAPETVLKLANTEAGVFGLRPELTASIARTAVTHLADSRYPQRLCYRANVFRQPPSGYHGRQVEFYQAGVELLFAGGVLADAEILLLLSECLAKLGVTQGEIILGEAALTRSLLLPFPDNLRAQVRQCLAHLDYVTLQNLPYPTPELRDRAEKIFHLRGIPEDVLIALSYLDLDNAARESLGRLKSLLDIYRSQDENLFPLTLDLSFVQTFDYYTGIVFQIVAPRENHLAMLGQGGRYDQLLSLYHPQNAAAPGIGFSLNIEEIHAILLPETSLPASTPPLDYWVIPATPQVYPEALRYAQNLRRSQPSLRVALQLEESTDSALRDYALNSRVQNLVWINPQGEAITENLSS